MIRLVSVLFLFLFFCGEDSVIVYNLRPNRSDGTLRLFAHELTVITDSQMSAIPESGRSGGSYIYEMTGRFRP